MERHTITIDTDGTPTIAVEGVKGRSCKQATDAIARALGVAVSDTETPEFYEQEVTTSVKTRN